MKNWEELYKSYKNGEMKKRYEELLVKINEKQANSEEYKEFSKMTKIMGNLTKVENIMQYRDMLETELEILKNEYVNSRQVKEKLEKENKRLDQEMEKNFQKYETIISEKKKVTKRISEIDNELKKDTLTDEEKEKLKKEKVKLGEKKVSYNKQLSDLSKKTDENNEKFSKNQNIDNKIEENKELSKFSKNEIRNKCFKVSSMISKCNFVAGKLMEGQSRESLEIALKNWKDKKFTSKTPLPLTRAEKTKRNETKMKDSEDKGKTEEEGKDKKEKDKIGKEPSGELEEESKEGLEEEGKENNNLTEKNAFEQQFPRMSKFLPKFFKNSKFAKSIANWNINRKSKKSEKTETEENLEEALEKELENIIKPEETKENKREKFKDYLKYNIDILDVAEKGMNEINKTRGKEKLEKAKRQAYNREEEKYGKEYAEKSYHMEDDEGR